MAVQYLDLLKRILSDGVDKGDRTGTGTRSLFGAQLRFDLREGFPLLTTKKLPFRWIAEELFWMLSGSTDEAELRVKGVDIWKEWGTKEQCARFGRAEGDLGPIYGHQWRNFGARYRFGAESETVPGTNYHHRVSETDAGVDQIATALRLLQSSPDSRRIIVSGWNPFDAAEVALPPCHTVFQFGTHLRGDELVDRVDPDHPLPDTSRRVLSCHMYQRSADVFLGVPFNIASYALLTHLFARVLDYDVGTLTISFGDVHIYNNHRKQVWEQISRAPCVLPSVRIPSLPRPADCTPLEQLLAIRYEDLSLEGYKPHPKIAAPVAV